jgi:hypothetical protein
MNFDTDEWRPVFFGSIDAMGVALPRGTGGVGYR